MTNCCLSRAAGRRVRPPIDSRRRHADHAARRRSRAAMLADAIAAALGRASKERAARCYFHAPRARGLHYRHQPRSRGRHDAVAPARFKGHVPQAHRRLDTRSDAAAGFAFTTRTLSRPRHTPRAFTQSRRKMARKTMPVSRRRVSSRCFSTPSASGTRLMRQDIFSDTGRPGARFAMS